MPKKWGDLKDEDFNLAMDHLEVSLFIYFMVQIPLYYLFWEIFIL